MFSKFPVELKHQLFSFFSPFKLRAVALTCKENNTLSSQPRHWKDKVQADFYTDVPEQMDAKTFYMQLYREREAVIYYMLVNELFNERYRKILISAQCMSASEDMKLKAQYRQQMLENPFSLKDFFSQLVKVYGVVNTRKDDEIKKIEEMIQSALAKPSLVNKTVYEQYNNLLISKEPKYIFSRFKIEISNEEEIQKNYHCALNIQRVILSFCHIGADGLLKIILDKHKELLNFEFKGNYTLLHNAILYNRLESMKLLIERGAKVNIQNYDWNPTPLYFAITKMAQNEVPWNIALIEYLLEKGADIELECANIGSWNSQESSLKLCHRLYQNQTRREVKEILDMVIDHKVNDGLRHLFEIGR